MILSIPSPSSGTIEVGPLDLHAYGLFIAAGVLVAVWWSERRWAAAGGDPADIGRIALWAVPAGIIGARAYHVATDWHLYDDDPLEALAVWDGGLGIWGGVLLGAVVGAVVARRRRVAVAGVLDAVAPTLPLAQAIGRWGNYFNQELFGGPSTLPWALRIDPERRPEGYVQFETFHPTFLYEALWNLVVVGIVLVAQRRLRLRAGSLFALYVAAYTFGRFWVEWLRIDRSHEFFGLRLNDWTSIIVFVLALLSLAWLNRPGRRSAERPLEADVAVS